MNIEITSKEGYYRIWQIFIDDTLWREAHPLLFHRAPHLSAQYETLEQLEKEFYALEYEAAKNFALNSLASVQQTSLALTKKLQDRLVSEKIIQDLIKDFRQKGYLNDKEWMENFVRSKQKKYGSRKVSLQLKNKGFKDDEIIEHMHQHKDSQTQQQKVIASLARRGFDFSDIQEVLNCTENEL
jgi:SOS response regulatory protein OraA/RecX